MPVRQPCAPARPLPRARGSTASAQRGARRLTIAWIVGVAAALAQSIVQAGDRHDESALDAELSRLGEHPSADAALALAKSPGIVASSFAARRLVLALRGGGHGSCVALAALAGHGDADVRAAALRALGDVGLHLSDGLEPVRAARRDTSRDVVCAAYEALGRVGDARDVSALIEGMASGDAGVARAAHRSLRAMTGASLAGDPSLWISWWNAAKTTLAAELDGALACVAEGSTPEQVQAARRVLGTSAWVDVERVGDAARRCLRSPNPKVRAEGFRIAAAARLGGLADDLGKAVASERDSDTRAVAKAAADMLGIATPEVAAAGAVVATAGERPARAAAPRPVAASPAARPAASASVVAGADRAATSLPAVAGATGVDERLGSAGSRMIAGDYDGARGVLDDVVASADEATRRVARKGYVAIYWLRRIEAANPSTEKSLREEARRSLQSTPWERFF